MPEVSLVATLVATLSGFVLGALWYGPLFGKMWMRAVGRTQEELQRDFNAAKTYGTTFVLGLIASFVFGVYIGPHPAIKSAVACGAAVGVLFVATSLATNDLFERRSLTLTLINGGYHAKFTLIGLTFGLLG